MTAQDRQPTAIIGIGNALRRDDGVGPLVLDACRYDPLPACDLIELDGEATHVVEAWRGRELAIVVDAVCTGAEAGTLHDLTIDDVDNVGAMRAAESAHFAGLAEALTLGRSLSRLPAKLRVIGIEPGDLKHGFGLSPSVEAAMEEVIGRVREAATGSAEAIPEEATE